ncbi:hypothetical protein CO608_10365, partial [Lysobacteraceae bacterium NML08-0793]
NATAAVGEEVTFTITVTNHGPSAAADVTVAEQLPSGYTLVSATATAGSYSAPTWTLGTLANGAVETLTLKATVNATGDYTNTATVSSTTPDGNPNNDTDSAKVTPPAPPASADLGVTKVVDNATAAVGEEVTFTITVTNHGPSAAADVTVAEQLPSGYTLVSATATAGSYSAPTWTLGTLANGAVETLTLKATVNATGDYTNTATVSSTTPDGNPNNDTDSAKVTPVQPSAELVLTKAVNNAAPAVGENVEFTITVTNKGPSVAENVKVTEYLPSGYTLVSATPEVGSWSAPVWMVGTLAVGDTAVMKLVATVLPSGDYTNVVTAESSTPLLNPETPRAEVSTQPSQSSAAQLTVEKRGSVNQAEVGDVVLYTIRIRNNGQFAALQPVLVDRLPAGFLLVGETAAVSGANLLSLTGAPGSVLRMQLDAIAPGAEVVVQYRVRLSVGAQQGDGINRAHMECPVGQGGMVACSNEDQWQIRANGGVFSNEGCVVGQIYVDANGNSVKDREELGIPGVRMYFQDGTYMISDVEGKYSYCGLRPVTHVLKVDSRTLPRGSRLVTSSSRNAGDANSLFIDLKAGELHRADFIEGSASNEVLEQVKARRANGEVHSVESEPGQPALKFESKPAPQGNPLQQGTDSANQLIERARNEGGR